MKPVPTRLLGIDFVRGVAIAEMIVSHFAAYLPAPLPKLIAYVDTAMALFVVLAGFMVGWRITEFRATPRAAATSLIVRAGKIFAVQCGLVLTAGVALYGAAIAGVPADQSLAQFLRRSLLLQNQVGLLHILPTFIPLFVIAPVVLAGLARGWMLQILIASVALFIVGTANTDAFGYGDPAIFPVVLFQLYFVLGCVAGCWCRQHGMPEPVIARRWLPVAVAALALSMAVVHFKVVAAGSVQTHPLNLIGLLYHAPLIATVVLAGLAFEPWLRLRSGYATLTRFGRHSMLAFVLHVFGAVTIKVANASIALPMTVNLVLIAASIWVIDVVIARFEQSRRSPAPPRWSATTQLLFG